MQVDYIAAFLIGLIGGFSHCIGMCGGFVLTYSVKISENEIRKQQTVWQRIYPHLSYSAGRIITYTFLGEIFGFIGGTIGLIFSMKNFQGGLQLFAGIIMFFMGLDLAGLIPVLPPNSFPGINAFKKLVGRGCYVLLSNSDTEFIRKIYKDYKMFGKHIQRDHGQKNIVL